MRTSALITSLEPRWSRAVQRTVAGAVLVVATLTGLVGCAPLPVSELSQYRAAFGQAQEASEAVLIDYAQVLDNARSTDAGGAATRASGAHRFSSELDEIGAEEVSDVEVRRLALQAIDRYNDALGALAEGRSIDSVRAATNGFVQVVGEFAEAGGGAIPGFGAISGIVQSLAEQAERARLRAEFERVVREGAGIVEQILDALIADRVDHMALRTAEADARQVAIILRMRGRIVGVRTLLSERTPPGAGAADPLAGIRSDLADALSGTGLFEGVALAYGTDAPGISETDRQMASQLIVGLAADVDAYRANIEQHEAFRDVLKHYGVLLEKTKDALDALEVALDRPVDLEASADELFQIAFSIKRDLEAVRAARVGAAK